MPKFVNLHTTADGSSMAEALRAVMQYQGKSAVVATALTDSSAGAASASRLIATVIPAVATANSATSLADKVTTEAAMVTVQNALATLYAKTATATAVLGLPAITYSGGGASGGNTVAAVTKTVTAAAVGVPVVAWNAFSVAVGSAFYQLGRKVNELCVATGAPLLDLSALKGTAILATVPAMVTATGAAADPGLTAAKAGADLTVFANNVATVAARITNVVASPNLPGAVAVA